MNKAISYVKRTAGVLIIPAVCFVLMSLACYISGTSLFTGESTVRLYFRGLAYVLLLSYGVSINMHTGRFDFSVGATMLLSGVSSAIIAYRLDLGPELMLVIAAIIGAVVGTVTGVFYVTLRLPPMIIGLGMTLVLEGIVAIITDGCKPVGFGTNASYYRFAVNIPAMLIVSAIAIVLMLILFRYTSFGYDYRALVTGQKIAVNAGVREKSNAVFCYGTAGFLLGAAGALSICSTNGVTPTINFTSIGSMFACFLPLFFSDFIIRFTDKQIAVFAGCAAYEFIQVGFGQISFIVASFTADVYRVVEAVILVLFLIYLNNETRVTDAIKIKRKLRKNA